MLNVIKRIGKRKALCSCVECSTEYLTDFYDARKSRLGHLCTACKISTGNPLNQILLKKLFNYDKATGVLTCKLPQHNRKIGNIIGHQNNTGYLVANVAGKSYLVHRLIWLYMTGYLPQQVDHIDHVKLNNRWRNLREVSNTENSKNCSISQNSKTKVNGVSFIPSSGRYRAYVMINRKQIHLGVFKTIAEATRARKQADKDYNFHANHGK